MIEINHRSAICLHPELILDGSTLDNGRLIEVEEIIPSERLIDHDQTNH